MWTHYNTLQQVDMLRTVLAFQVTTLISQQCFIVPISKPEEKKLQKNKNVHKYSETSFIGPALGPKKTWPE